MTPTFLLRLRPICLLAAVVGLAAPAGAKFARPEQVPVERLLVQANADVAKDPGSAERHYTLARIHYLAFSRAARAVPAYLPSAGFQQLIIPAESRTGDWRPPLELSLTERATHAIAGAAAFREAIRLAPDRGLYVLGLASLVEQVVEWKETAKAERLWPELASFTKDEAAALYLRAFRLAQKGDAGARALGVEGLMGMVSHEAGAACLRLSAVDDNVRREIQDYLKRLKAIPRGAVTPVVFSLQPATGLAQLLASETIVSFDLRGYGPRDRWSWLQPSTGLLVWDPARRGEIVSGRQLFGAYTFEIFRDDGYAALAALDDDRDGVLAGAELSGIRAWFDRNGDGRSQREEVRDLSELDIVGIAARATGHEGVHPRSDAGLRLRDGRTLPTWDWMVEARRD